MPEKFFIGRIPKCGDLYLVPESDYHAFRQWKAFRMGIDLTPHPRKNWTKLGFISQVVFTNPELRPQAPQKFTDPL